MRSLCSVSADAAAFAHMALRLAREGADMLLCHPAPDGGSMPGGWRLGNAPPCCLAGILPRRELTVTESTTDAQLRRFCFETEDVTLGFLSYPLGLIRHGIAGVKPRRLPLGVLRRYAVLLQWFPHNGRLTLMAAQAPPNSLVVRLRALARECAAAPSPPEELRLPLPGAGIIFQSLGRAGYMRGVETVLERIGGGDVYQLNLADSFSMSVPELDAPAFFLRRWLERPAPHAGLLHCGAHKILSFSPERFLRVCGGEVLTAPVKGTRRLSDAADPRAEASLEARMRAELAANPKERAELSMVVDLLRNDLSACCSYGSVEIDGHCRIFRVGKLLQMFSVVRGRLAAGHTCLDLLLAAFPGGSVTGCPKPRAMEIIEELESYCREVYCGALLAVRDARNMDSSVAIRTGWHDARDGTLTFPAGSGLTIESDPADEYEETVVKAAAFYEAWPPERLVFADDEKIL